jgi:hypothetical protein
MDTSTRVIDAYCEYHLGDNIINFIFFSQIANYLEENNVHIKYYCQESHHKNLNDFKSSNHIHLLPYEKTGRHLWQGTENLKSGKYIEDILCDMFNQFLAFHDIPIVLDKFEYRDSDLLIKNVDVPGFEPIRNSAQAIGVSDLVHSPETCMERSVINVVDRNGVDTLIINSTPMSGQFSYDKNEMNWFIRELSKTRKIAVTEYLDDSILSLHDKWIREIAAIAKTVRTVIAINTGPSIGLYNTEVLDSVDNIYLLDNAPYADYRFKTRKFTKIDSMGGLGFLL